MTTSRFKRGTMAFFVGAFAITWTLQLPAVLARFGAIPGPLERYMLPVGLGGFGPLLAAVLVSRFEPGGPGVRALLRPLRIWRVNVVWYLLALGLPAVAYVAGDAVYTLCGGTHAEHWLWLPGDGQHIAAMIVFPIGEEIGWRGLALPRLQEKHGALAASQLVGIAWTLWHIPMFIIAGFSPAMFGIMFMLLMAGSVTTSWIYNRAGGSLLLAVLVHVGAHLNNPNQAFPPNMTPLLIETVALCVVAVALVLFDRHLGSSRQTK